MIRTIVEWPSEKKKPAAKGRLPIAEDSGWCRRSPIYDRRRTYDGDPVRRPMHQDRPSQENGGIEKERSPANQVK